jgi:hypothetical protein
MSIDEGHKPEGTPERSPKAGEGVPSGVVVEGMAKRFSVQRKRAVVKRLLRGEPLEVFARETNVPVWRLTDWRDRPRGRRLRLEERELNARGEKIARLKAKVGEITMDKELLCAKIAVMEGKGPLARRRP